jgi:hypothetical protein
MRLLFCLGLLTLAFSAKGWSAELPDPPPCSGCFVGTLHLSPNPEDSATKILDEDLFYVDSDGLVWKAGKGDVTDGASIPALFQPIVGGPWEDDYLPAAVMHDHYCDDKHRVRTWRATDRMFYQAMIVNHTDIMKAKLMYYAVYSFGPHWAKLKPGVGCGTNCLFSIETKMSYQPPDYDLNHQKELDDVGAAIRSAEIRGESLSLSQLEDLSLKNHSDNQFILNDDTR